MEYNSSNGAEGSSRATEVRGQRSSCGSSRVVAEALVPQAAASEAAVCGGGQLGDWGGAASWHQWGGAQPEGSGMGGVQCATVCRAVGQLLQHEGAVGHSSTVGWGRSSRAVAALHAMGCRVEQRNGSGSRVTKVGEVDLETQAEGHQGGAGGLQRQGDWAGAQGHSKEAVALEVEMGCAASGSAECSSSWVKGQQLISSS